MQELKSIPLNELEMVHGHRKTKTTEAKWLHLTDIHQKLLKSGDYDIGGTYNNNEMLEFWFTCKTDHFGNNFMLHIFVANRHEGSFSVEISHSNEICDLTSNTSTLMSRHFQSNKTYTFTKCSDNKYNFVKTFSFDNFDLQQLKPSNLLIPFKLLHEYSEQTGDEIREKVQLNHKFDYLLKNPIYSDFSIKSVDGHEFKVHKIILITHSEVFKAMLKEETAESLNKSVELQFLKEEIECMLEFMYTGVVNTVTCDCLNLMILADQFNIPGLSVIVQNLLCRQINDENVLELLVHSDMHNCDLLKREALRYIKHNPTKIVQSESWKHVHPNLVKLIFAVLQKDERMIKGSRVVSGRAE